MGHFLCDFTLQSDRMAIEKKKGEDMTLDWKYWLTAHSGTHALFVALLLGSPSLGAAEWVAHFTIDYCKSRGLYSLLMDQILHLVCKVIWVSIYVGF